MKPNNWNWL